MAHAIHFASRKLTSHFATPLSNNHLQWNKRSAADSNNFQDKANFIWQVADEILRGTFKPHECGDIILPFVVLRRLDCVLEPKRNEVIKNYKELKSKKLSDDQLYGNRAADHNRDAADLRH